MKMRRVIACDNCRVLLWGMKKGLAFRLFIGSLMLSCLMIVPFVNNAFAAALKCNDFEPLYATPAQAHKISLQRQRSIVMSPPQTDDVRGVGFGRPLTAPLRHMRTTSTFGKRVHPVHGSLRMHSGVDLAAPIGTSVYAAASGVVRVMVTEPGYGKYVLIEHADSVQTLYGHLLEFEPGLKSGQMINVGDRLGSVGSTGVATGPHLHFEVRVSGRAVNPLGMISNMPTVAKGVDSVFEKRGTSLGIGKLAGQAARYAARQC